MAVLAVVVSHCSIPLTSNAGTTGVTIFFVLSGFLITRNLLGEHARTGRLNLRDFYVRRAARLGPALLLFLATCAILFHVAGMSLMPIAASALYTANIAMVVGVPMGVLEHMWSLSLEEQFYVLWPLVLLFLIRKRRPAVIAAALAGGIVLVTGFRLTLTLGGAPESRMIFGPDTRADALMIGCLLAFVIERLTTRSVARAAAVGAIVLGGALPWGSIGSWTLLPVALASAGVIAWAAGAGSRGPAFGLLCSTPMVGLGKISYGVYLWHLPVVRLMGQDLHPVGQLALGLGLSIALAWVSWRFVEMPVLDRVRRPASPRVRPASVAGRRAGAATGEPHSVAL
jgi:peptidoglycan/LPS O-acetylase OafA/YrhL